MPDVERGVSVPAVAPARAAPRLARETENRKQHCHFEWAIGLTEYTLKVGVGVYIALQSDLLMRLCIEEGLFLGVSRKDSITCKEVVPCLRTIVVAAIDAVYSGQPCDILDGSATGVWR